MKRSLTPRAALTAVTACAAISLIAGPLAGVSTAAAPLGTAPTISLTGGGVVTDGHTVTLHGAVSLHGHGLARTEVVLLQRSAAGSWQPAGLATTGHTGAFSFHRTISGGAAFEVTAAAQHGRARAVSTVADVIGAAPSTGTLPVSSLVGTPRDLAAPAFAKPEAQTGAGGQFFASEVGCNGNYDFSSLFSDTLVSYRADFLNVVPQITPDAGWAAQYVASRVYFYDYATGQWSADGWKIAVAAAPQADTITVGWAPSALDGNYTVPAGTDDWYYIYTAYDWYGANGWETAQGAYTTSYTQYDGHDPYQTTAAYCHLNP